jgi:LETM1 and EF-hand domain-containing protein 1
MAEKPADVDSTAAEFLGFLEKARTGEFVSPEVIIRFSKYFQDELTLDNLPRTQLVNLCKYMSIPSYGSDPFLRFQLRHKIRSLKEDDQKILWEGIDSLTKIELSEACRERGMRSTGLSKEQYKVALQQWLDLSVNQNVPISLLIMSRSFFLFEPKSKLGQRGSVSGISDAISAMDKDILNQVVLEVATPEERSHNPEVVKISLQVLEHENEKIRAEFEERQASKRKEEEKKKGRRRKEKG